MSYRRELDRLTEADMDKICQLRAEGVTAANVAARFHTSPASVRLITSPRLCVECGEPLRSLNHQRKRHADCRRVRCECGNPVSGGASRVCLSCLALGETASNDLKAFERAVRHKDAPKHHPTSIFVQHDPILTRYKWANAVNR